MNRKRPSTFGMESSFQSLIIWVREVFSDARIIAKEPRWVGENETATIKTIYGTKYNYTITITREKIR
jgi:hypothetical protein